MAKTQKLDPAAMAAAKQRKQKIMLGVIAGVLVLLAAIQGPKLMKQLSGGSTPAASAPAETTPATPATTTGAATADGAAAALAGAAASAPATGDLATRGKLVSFTLFATKDPFVPQMSEKTSTGAEPAASDATPPAAAPDAPDAPAAVPSDAVPSDAAAGATPGDTPAQPDAPALTDATLEINGTPEYLKATELFPKIDPVFRLVSLKPKSAKIGVAGGSFTVGKLLVLKLGKSVTLVNTATGARYQIELVYTGMAPEKVVVFTTGPSTGDDSGQTTTGSTVDATAP